MKDTVIILSAAFSLGNREFIWKWPPIFIVCTTMFQAIDCSNFL